MQAFKLPLLSQRKNLILLKGSSWEVRGSELQSSHNEGAESRLLPKQNKPSNQLSNHEDPHPYLPRAATAPMEIFSTERLFLLKKMPSLVFPKQVSRGELGPSLTRTIAWGKGEQHQQFSVSKLNPHPAENNFFFPLGVLLSPSLIL